GRDPIVAAVRESERADACRLETAPAAHSGRQAVGSNNPAREDLSASGENRLRFDSHDRRSPKQPYTTFFSASDQFFMQQRPGQTDALGRGQIRENVQARL